MAQVSMEERAARVRRFTAPPTYEVRGPGSYEGGREAAMTAAAARIDPTSEADVRAFYAHKQAWQRQVWPIYDDVGEIRRSAQFMADCISRLRWFVGVRDPHDPDGSVLPLDATTETPLGEVPIATPDEQMAAADAVARLRSDENTLNDLMRALTLQIFMPGEGYLIGRTVDGQERWNVYSVDAVQPSRDRNGSWRILDAPAGGPGMPSTPGSPGPYLTATAGGGGTGEELDDDAIVIRLWRRHPQWSGLADSAIRSVMVEAEELRVLTRSVMGSALSRLNNGILVVPKRRGMPGSTEGPGGPPASASKLTAQIIEHTTTPIADPESAAAVAPFILEVDPEDADKVKHITLDRDSGVQAEERQELIRRILQSIDVPLENILGLGDTSTYANARLVTEQTFDTHLAPLAVLLAHSMTVGYLMLDLRARGIENPSRFALWFDPAQLVGRPGLADAAILAYDRGEASGRFLREANGIPEEAEPDEEELARRAARAAAIDVPATETQPTAEETDPPPTADRDTDTSVLEIANALQKLYLPVVNGVMTADEARALADEMGAGLGPLPDTEALIAAAMSAASRSRMDRFGTELARRDDMLRARLQGALGALVTRAAEKVGAQARTKARNTDSADLIARTPNGLVCAQLGPAMTAALDLDAEETIAAVIAAAEAQTLAWMAAAQADVLTLAEGFGELDPADRAAIEAAQEEDRNAAWLLISAATAAVASSRLFTPDPAAPPVGEFDAAQPMPPGPVRAALAVAGGAQGTTVNVPVGGSDSTGVTVPSQVIDADGAPAGGIYEGRTALDAYRRVGLQVGGYRWLVGAPANPFDPHQRLAGVEFDRWDDPQLTNGSPWPGGAFYYPGDHLGCQCSFELRFDPEET